jgi:hypothetical protein
LSDGDRGAVVLARLRGAGETVEMEFLGAAGTGQLVAATLRGLGATIRFADGPTGYVFARVPCDQVLVAVELPAVEHATVTQTYFDADVVPVAERRPKPVPEIELPIPMVSTIPLPPDGIYFPAEEAGLSALRAEYPEGDGGGVRIGLCDDGVELLHPALQLVRAGIGCSLPKIADFEPASTTDIDGSWVLFDGALEPTDGKASFAGRDWIVPPAGDAVYHIGILARTLAMGYPHFPDVKKVALHVGVLWDSKNNVVRVDTDGDGNFISHPPLRDYAEAHEFDWFGHLDRDEDHRIPFGVKIDRKRGAAWLSFVAGPHGTYVAGSMCGNRLTAGLYDGSAPQAQIVDIRAVGCVLAGMIRAAARPDVDIVNRSGGVGRDIAGGREEFQKLVLARIVEIYDKPILLFGRGLGTIFILDYQSPEMLRRNRQIPPPYDHTVTSSVAFDKNGLVNVLLAPSTPIVTQSRYVPIDYAGNDGKRYISSRRAARPPAPSGYGIGCNPSCTISLASGVAATLIGLARQKSIRFNAERLTNALFIGARAVPGFPMSQQGRGLINAAGAWRALAAMARADDPANPVLTEFEVTRDGDRVEGCAEEFERSNGPSRAATLWVTRHGGHEGARAYRLALRGDTGVCTLTSTRLELTRDRAAPINLTLHAQPHAHIAFLQLIDEAADATMLEIPIHVRAPASMEAIAPGVEQFREAIPPRRGLNRIFQLDDRAQAVRVVIEIPCIGPGNVQSYSLIRGNDVLLRRPTEEKSPDGASLDAAHHIGPMDRLEGIFVPKPGLTTLYWENRGRPEYESPDDPPAPDISIVATLTVTKYAVGLERTVSGDLTVHNKLATIEGAVEFLAGSVVTRRLEVEAPHGFGVLELMVPEGLAIWHIGVTGDGANVAEADLYAVHCGENDSAIVAQAVLKNGAAILTIASPQAGAWRIVLWERGTNAASRSRYTVKAVPLTTSSGRVEPQSYASGAQWRVGVPTASAPDHAIYAGFRLKPVSDAKEGMLIGLTQLSG